MKTVTQFFGEDLPPYTGVRDRIARVAPTEYVHPKMCRLEGDFDFIMKDGFVNMRFTQG